MLTRTRSRRMPALLTRTWRPPKASTAALMSRWPASQSATLSALAMASPPMALTSSTTCWAGVRSSPEPSMAPPRSLTTILAPSLANSSACSRPMPRPDPVMMATRPSRAPIATSSTPSAFGGETLPGVEVDARPAVDLLTGGRVGDEDLLRGRSEHVGHLQSGLLQNRGGVLDVLARDVGDVQDVGALRHRHRDLAPLGRRGARTGCGRDALVLG